jgi:hypothetical protein
MCAITGAFSLAPSLHPFPCVSHHCSLFPCATTETFSLTLSLQRFSLRHHCILFLSVIIAAFSLAPSLQPFPLRHHCSVFSLRHHWNLFPCATIETFSLTSPLQRFFLAPPLEPFPLRHHWNLFLCAITESFSLASSLQRFPLNYLHAGHACPSQQVQHQCLCTVARSVASDLRGFNHRRMQSNVNTHKKVAPGRISARAWPATWRVQTHGK